MLRLAKTDGLLRFVWSWPDVDVAGLDPAMVIVSQDPDGRWYVTFTIEAGDPEPLPPAWRAVAVDLGVRDFAVTSDGERIPNPRHLERRARSLARYQRRMARCQAAARTGRKQRRRSLAPTVRSATRGGTSCTAPVPAWSAATM